MIVTPVTSLKYVLVYLYFGVKTTPKLLNYLKMTMLVIAII